MIAWRIREEIIRIILCCVVYDSCAQWYAYCIHMWEVLRGEYWLWSPYVIGQTIIFSCCGLFFLSIYLFFSSPNLSRRTLDVCHTSTHGVALVRISDAGLKPAARGSLKTQDAKKSSKIAICAPSRNFVGPYLRNYGTYRQSEKNLLSSNTSSTCPDNMVNFGPLTAEIGSGVWSTPTNFNEFCFLAALLHGI